MILKGSHDPPRIAKAQDRVGLLAVAVGVPVYCIDHRAYLFVENEMELTMPFKVLGEMTGGGLGMLLSCADANGIPFAGKFPKDRHPANQQLVIEEERRFHRHQGKHVAIYYGTMTHPDGRRGFAMELMEGSLFALVASTGPLSGVTALAYFANAAAGLNEVHKSAEGAFHGDIKLPNILYRGSTAKLADFGLARGGVGQTQMLGPHGGGTPGYYPPEGYASTGGDVYSLGVALWAMLAGREPVVGEILKLAEVQPKLAALFHGMLAIDPKARLRMAAVLAHLPAVRVEAHLALVKKSKA
jgi:serine/threonine protein kinase